MNKLDSRIRPAKGKVGVLLPGMGAVTSTFIAGVELVKKGLGTPVGSVTQMQAIRLGRPGDGQLASFVESVNGQPVANVDEAIGRLSLPGTNTAVVRGLSGSAAERAPASQPVAFRYQLRTTIQPFAGAPGSAAAITN